MEEVGQQLSILHDSVEDAVQGGGPAVRNFSRKGRLKLIIFMILPIGSMYAIYGNIYHQYVPNVSIYTIHGSYGL